MRKPFYFIPPPLIGLILVGLIYSGLSRPLPEVARFLFTVGATVFLPGYLLATRFFRISCESPLLGFPLYSLLGLSAVSVLTWFVLILGIPFFTYLSILQIASAVFFAAVLWMDFKRRRRPDADKAIRSSIDSKRARLLYGLLAIFLCLFFFFREVPLDIEGDHYDHIGFIRAIVTENDMDPPGVLAPLVGEEDSAVKSDPRKGVLHPYLGAVAMLSDLSPQDVWRYLPVILAPAAFLSFLAFTVKLLPAGGYRFACLLLFLLFHGGSGLDYLSRSAYGQNISIMYCWMLFFVSMIYARSRQISLLFLSMLILWGGSVIHINVLPQFLLMAAAFVLFPGVFGFARGERIRLIAAAAVVAAVVFLWKWSVSYQGGNILHVHPQGLLYFGSKFFVISPVEILKRYGLVYWGGIVLVPFLFLARSGWKYAKRHLALSVLPIFFCFVPFVTPVAYGKATYLIHRLVEGIPSFHIIVLLISSLLVWGRKGTFLKRVSAVLVVSFWAWLFIAPSLTALASKSIGSSEGETQMEFEDIVRYFKLRAPRGSVVLSDPITSYRLSARNELKVVAVLHQHGNPNDPFALDRLKAVRDVLSPYVTQEEALPAMDRYGVQYVVLSGSVPQPEKEFLIEWDPNNYDTVKTKFDLLPDVFEKVLESENYVIYRRLDGAPKNFAWTPENLFQIQGKKYESSCGVMGWNGAVEVRSVEVEPKIALAGEEVRLKIVYEKMRDVVFALPVKLYVRFDNEALFSKARVYPGEKYVRRLKERWSRQYSRFRVDHRPFGGLYEPDIWPIGSQVAEVIRVDLPGSLKTGNYSIRMKLVQDSLIPNHSYRDFLYNNDSYSGLVCASIEIKEFIVR